MTDKFSTHSNHTSVLLHECAHALDIENTAQCTRFIDATMGMGGHSKHFLDINPNITGVCFDQDPFAREKAKKHLEIHTGRYTIIPQNFATIGEQKDFSPHAILFDIGVSSLQFDTPERGFSFRFSGPLDMRMNPETELTAEIIINTWNEEKLEQIFLDYGEESWGRHIAKKIVEHRVDTPFSTTDQLAEFITKVKPFTGKKGKNQGGHPAALIFQALRIAVNSELDVLQKALDDALEILEPNGRLAVISFHSLEDRIVKQTFERYISKGKKQKYPSQKSPETPQINEGFLLEKVSKKPIIPSRAECEANPRARSAKLRCVIKKTV